MVIIASTTSKATLQSGGTLDHNDFVDSDGSEVCDIEDSTENPEWYQRGFYYPICIGEVLAQTYRIEHKLGHGGFSTVWMAHDIRKGKDVALKTMVPGNTGEYELTMQKEIIRTVRNTSSLLTYLTTFSLPGHQGNHQVLVFPVRGPSLGSCLRERPIATRMSAAKQLLEALECLHKGGIVHRGELTLTCSLRARSAADFFKGNQSDSTIAHQFAPPI
jgi:serine/threonine protein kinase